MKRLAPRLALGLLPLLLVGAACSPKGAEPVAAVPQKDLAGETFLSVQDSAAHPEKAADLAAKLEKTPPSKDNLNDLVGLAANSGATENVRTLLQKGADPNGTGDGYPLTTAATSGNLDLVDLLIEKGANVNLRVSQRPTLLATLAAGDQPDIMERVLGAGADPNLLSVYTETRRRVLKHGNPALEMETRTWSPLMIAAALGKPKNVETLLRHKANRAQRSREGTAYDIATERGFSEVAKLLKP